MYIQISIRIYCTNAVKEVYQSDEFTKHSILDSVTTCIRKMQTSKCCNIDMMQENAELTTCQLFDD